MTQRRFSKWSFPLQALRRPVTISRPTDLLWSIIFIWTIWTKIFPSSLVSDLKCLMFQWGASCWQRVGWSSRMKLKLRVTRKDWWELVLAKESYNADSHFLPRPNRIHLESDCTDCQWLSCDPGGWQKPRWQLQEKEWRFHSGSSDNRNGCQASTGTPLAKR